MIVEIANNTGILNGDIQTLRGHLRNARTHVKELHEQMEHMNNMWSGPANSVMRQRFQADYESVTGLCDFLERLINNLETARRAYESCENNVGGVVASIHIN